MATKQTLAPRTQTNYVRAYLEALERGTTRPGKRSTAWLQEQVQTLPERIHEEPDALKRVVLTQRLIDCEADLVEREAEGDLSDLEANFVQAVGPWTERTGVTYKALRAQGVPARVLREAGLGGSRQ
jgi:hypothetical protein